MKAIVLAGGFGTRIQPLTSSLPKPMLPILNRPMMEHIIIKLRDQLGIKDIAVLLYFKPEIIKDHFGDGSGFGVNISYFQPDDDYGTAGAVAFAREFLDETFIIVSGDLVTNFDFQEIKKFHKSKKSKLTITLTSVENPLQFGVVISNKENQIEKFLEKPSWGEVFSDTINTGIYMIEPEILEYIPYGKNFDFAKDLFPTLMREDITLWGCPLEGYWRDVGNPVSYRDVYKDIFNKDIILPIKGKAKKVDKGVIYMEEDTNLPEKLRLKGTVILGKNVKIAEGVTLQNCSIGDNTTINKHSAIIDSVLWNDIAIGSKVHLQNSVICNNNLIDDKSKASFGVIIAEKCEIKKKVAFEKDITIWAEKIIEENSIVSENVIWGTKYKSSIFENGVVKGRTNIELSAQMSTKLAESFGSILPIGSTVYVSRDFHSSSRMLKRAFLSGILSTGVNVVDLRNVPSNVMKYCLGHREDIAAGIHFRRSIFDPTHTEVIFYTSEGLQMGNKVSQSIERIFFRESFRRVGFNEIGEIYDNNEVTKQYIKAIKSILDGDFLKNSDIRVAVDLMNGSSSDTYPLIVNEFGVENILLNAYKAYRFDSNDITKYQEDMQNVVRAMNYDCGFLIYPNGSKLQLVDNKGNLVYDYTLLLIVLHLLDTTTTQKLKVFLPVWAPDFIKYNNIDITKAKFGSFKAKQLQGYDLIADTDGHFAFSEFNLSKDALFSSFKILQLLQKSGEKLSKIIAKFPNFYFKGENVPCPSELKGKMMRKFLEDGQNKKTSSIDGVKIWLSEDEWILMVPSQYSEFLNIYIQAEDEKSAGRIFYRYQDKIEKWVNE
ncbi:MAG: sugar phosphate nucleotidyltransferase [Campylobacterota bacterium]|nr:sugar phosphate nucleotidyltransferase [Campylobacterota bacterium]